MPDSDGLSMRTLTLVAICSKRQTFLPGLICFSVIPVVPLQPCSELDWTQAEADGVAGV